MAFIDKYKQDNNHRSIYGTGLPGDPSGDLYILDFLIPKVAFGETLTFLRSEYERINRK